VYDTKLDVITEGETQLYYQTIRGQLLCKQNTPIFEVSTLDHQINTVRNHEINFFFLDDFEFLNVMTKMAIDNLKSAKENLIKLDPNLGDENQLVKSKLF
jgi:uncharacterized HAD superfamily protein